MGRAPSPELAITGPVRRVCVFCGAGSSIAGSYLAAGRELGGCLARAGLGLVYGGANTGVMAAVAEAALAVDGEVIGVIPEALVRRGMGGNGPMRLHVVDSMHERKAVMYRFSDAFVALPGGLGTLEELFEVVTWAKLGLHDKPLIVLDVDSYFRELFAFLEHAEAEGFLTASQRGLVRRAGCASKAVQTLQALLAGRPSAPSPTGEQARRRGPPG